MGILNALQGGTSVSNNGSISSGQSAANSWQQSATQTDAASARAFSAEQATLAYKRQKELMQMEMDYNTREAEKQREWELNNANTIYTRSIQNMKEAGINPILAANMGLSAASVGSGATANISGASAPMAQSFMDTSSASAGGSQSYGENHGSSWGSSESESGLATGLQLMGEAIGNAINTMSSGNTINYMMSNLGEKAKVTWNDIKKVMIENLPNNVSKFLGITYEPETTGNNKVTRKKTVTGTYKFNKD